MSINTPRASPVIGHRGAAAAAPENTLISLREAARQGARWVEFDVKLTADGTVVLLHDDRLERTTDGTGEVARLSDALVSKLDAGSWFSPRFRGEPLPTLSAAFALMRDCGLSANIELKPSPGQAAATAAAVADVVRLERATFVGDIVVSSFSEDSLMAFATALPDVSRALLLRTIPVNWRDRADRVAADAIHCLHRGLTRSRVNGILSAGYAVRCFTVNEVATARRLLGWGVESVITDHPGRMLQGIVGLVLERGASYPSG